MLTPNHRMGVHWIPVHQRTADEEYFKALGPSAIKIINPDIEQIRRCLSYIHPNGVVVLRDHPLSEQKGDMQRDPVNTGIRHADEWEEELNTKFAGVDRGRLVVCGINEPFVRNDDEEHIVTEYTRAFLLRATQKNVRVLALNLSVGWPRNLGPGLPPRWDPFLSLERLILDNNGFLGVHEYWYDQPENGWGWLAGRVTSCPMTVPIIVGECGIDKLVDGERWRNEGQPGRGWISGTSPADYAAQLWRYADRLSQNVFAIMPFTTDWGSHDWDSMDTAGAQQDILRLKHDEPFPDHYPVNPNPVGPVIRPPVLVEPPTVPTASGRAFKLLWPAMDRITTYFAGDHSGIDIAVPTGTVLRALWDGIVAWSDVDDPTLGNGGYGNYIRIYHPDLGFDSFVGHLSERRVSNGQIVQRGDIIGLSGSTGNSTGPHVHLEIRMKEDNSLNDRQGCSAYHRAQVDPLAIKWMLHNLYGHDDYIT